MKIKHKLLGKESPCFIIAEAGVNHNGEIDKALELVNVANEAGADAVKFQLFDVKEQISRHAYNAPYQREGSGKKTMLEMAKSYDLPWEKHKIIADYAEKLGIIYMSSCFDKKAVDFFINKLDGDCIKVGSGEITNYPLLKYISNTGLPILLSTGMCDIDDVRGAVSHIQKNGSSPIILLHCVSNYPAQTDDLNIRSMAFLQKEFDLLVGYSDHSNGSTAAISAITLGAVVIEKHFTIDKTLSGPDHAMSLDPDELKRFVNKIRETEVLLGDGIKKPTKKEMEMRQFSRRSIVSKSDIYKGEILTNENLTLKRPATGIDGRDLEKVIGKKVNQDIPFDSIIKQEMIENNK